ncbi:MAG TPA: cadherin-like domain-containing protein, partial [Acidimicrobiales bacterium]|nr:cadherin-like domain-containing protein [Acidimicrobiales bacterium]
MLALAAWKSSHPADRPGSPRGGRQHPPRPPVPGPGALRGSTLPPNEAPQPVDDAHSTQEDTSLSVPAPGVLGNDSDPEGEPLTAAVATGPAHGTVVMAADGSFTFTPEPDYPDPAWRDDSFTYTASDGKATTTAQVRIRIFGVDDYPRAADDSYRAFPNVPLRVPKPGVLANDYDPEGAYMMVNVVNPPQNGTLQMGLEPNAGPGAFVYTPNPGFTGVDVFTYRVFQSDQHQETADIGQVSINVTDNVPPDAVDDAYSTNEETPL